MTLETGARLGPYEIVSLLGKGGMGEVYKARDLRLDRAVAIKIIRSADADDSEARQRFEHEGRLVAQISHANVLILHDFGVHEGAPYLVSEFLDGESLRALVSRGPIPARRAMDIAREIAEGLSAAHDRGIIHRDLKPENALITKAGQVKILDFGIAKLAKQGESADFADAPTAPLDTAPGRLVGTAGYISPEQIRGGEADSRSDIFALGAIIHEMLTGRRLFTRASAVESLNAILNDEPKELSDHGIAVSPGLERTMRRCLEKDPARRFQSAHDLAFALGAIETTRSIPAPQPATARFNPRTNAVIGAVLMAAAAFATGWRWPRNSVSAPTFEFQRLTFQPGASLAGARFAPDGETVVYDGRFGSAPTGVFTTRVGGHESRSLDLPPGTQLLAVSSTGEIAVRLADAEKGGVLAQVPLAGGVPRPLVEGVIFADWSPDGKELAVVRAIPGATRLEYPIGVVLAEVKRPSRIGRVRVSPDGDRVAFLEIAPGPNNAGQVNVVDRGGSRKTLTDPWFGGIGVAWSPDGSEVYFNGTSPLSRGNASGDDKRIGPPAIRAVDMNGRVRLVLKSLTELTLRDASHGRLLVTQTISLNVEMWFQSSKGPVERNLAWLNWSTPASLSPDGKLVLFDETRIGDGVDLVHLRKTDGSPAVRLGKGNALALSADGAWAAIVETKSQASPVVLMPTGAGESRTLKNAGLTYQDARFFADGKRLLVRANVAGHGARLLVLDVATGASQAITPEGVNGIALAPDGLHAVTAGPDGRVLSVPTEGGDGVALKGFENGDQPIEWSADGRSIFAVRFTEGRMDVFRVGVESGKRELFRSHSPRTAMDHLLRVLITPDGASTIVSSSPYWLELYAVDGIR